MTIFEYVKCATKQLLACIIVGSYLF